MAEGVQVEEARWSEEEGHVQVRLDDGSRRSFDLVWMATGGIFDMNLVPIFASLQAQHPIPCIDGLPDLQPDLSWAEGVPFHIMGAFAQLQLGPDALNLAGSRSGGVLVARSIRGDP